MAYTLLKITKQFVGKSTDTKPVVDGVTTLASDLPVGSTLTVTDTGDVFTWDGSAWAKPPVVDNMARLIQAIDLLRVEVLQLRYGMIDAGMCKETRLNDYQEVYSDYYREPV